MRALYDICAGDQTEVQPVASVAVRPMMMPNTG